MQGTMVPSLSGRIPHASGQLSSCATTTEPKHPKAQELQLLSPNAATIEGKPQWDAHTPQLEKASAKQQRLSPAKNKLKLKKQNTKIDKLPVYKITFYLFIYF